MNTSARHIEQLSSQPLLLGYLPQPWYPPTWAPRLASTVFG